MWKGDSNDHHAQDYVLGGIERVWLDDDALARKRDADLPIPKQRQRAVGFGQMRRGGLCRTAREADAVASPLAHCRCQAEEMPYIDVAVRILTVKPSRVAVIDALEWNDQNV